MTFMVWREEEKASSSYCATKHFKINALLKTKPRRRSDVGLNDVDGFAKQSHHYNMGNVRSVNDESDIWFCAFNVCLDIWENMANIYKYIGAAVAKKTTPL